MIQQKKEVNATTMTSEQTNVTNWIDEEIKNLNTGSFEGERLPNLKLETGKITKFTIDASKEFSKWTDANGVIKKMIPVLHKNERKMLWINVKNPLYKELICRISKGQLSFAVSTTGTQKETRYAIVEED